MRRFIPHSWGSGKKLIKDPGQLRSRQSSFTGSIWWKIWFRKRSFLGKDWEGQRETAVNIFKWIVTKNWKVKGFLHLEGQTKDLKGPNRRLPRSLLAKTWRRGQVPPRVRASQASLTIHQVQDEAEFIWRVEGVGHADNERTILKCKKKKQHRNMSEKQKLPRKAHLLPNITYRSLHPRHWPSRWAQTPAR